MRRFFNDDVDFEKSILVVDDDKATRFFFEQFMKKIGGKAYTAADGADGLDVFNSNKDDIGLVFVDLQMPHVNGVQFTYHIRSQYGDDIPIICISSYHKAAIDPMGLFTKSLEKPFNMDKLLHIVNQYIKKDDKKSSMAV